MNKREGLDGYLSWVLGEGRGAGAAEPKPPPEPQARAKHSAGERDSAAAASHGGATVELQSAASIAPQAIQWVWPGWLARGRLHILAGQPGAGKTTLALNFAAVISSAGEWPSGARAKPGSVVIWSGEDDPVE